MIVSWSWLKDYVDLGMSVEELTYRLTMSGLNLEGVEEIAGETAIDLEVTSNRPDCLGHLGVAREISVLYRSALRIPDPQPAIVTDTTASVTSVEIECEDLCPKYMARVVRNVKIGPSPEWMQKRLQTLGIAPVNNIVDITNYVSMECGQPLHAFDFDCLKENRIVVRRGKPGEKLTAINHMDYELTPEMCIIADGNRAVAIAGVMGGLDTEIGERTTTVLLEAADFDPLSIRNSARKLNLHSDSSFRFERGVDPEGIEWASRRSCELILEFAGGELLADPIVAGPGRKRLTDPIRLRYTQVPRIVGVTVPAEECHRILNHLGLKLYGDAGNEQSEFLAPPWRRDLTRECDLVEEVARIHGYDDIPEEVPVSLQLSAKTHHDRVSEKVKNYLTASGHFEAVTLTFVTRELFGLFQPHGDCEPLSVAHSSRKHENILRQSLIPSLLQSRRENEKQGVFDAQLFEISSVFLDANPQTDHSQSEPTMLGMVTGKSFLEIKGIVEGLIAILNRETIVRTIPSNVTQFVPGRGAELWVGDKLLGWVGELDRRVCDKLDLRDSSSAAELYFDVLEEIADLNPAYQPLMQFPAIDRDMNFVLDESVTWDNLRNVVQDAAGPLLEKVNFGGQYRGQQISVGKKSYLVTMSYRAEDRTLTNEEVEIFNHDIISACKGKLKAELR